MKATVRSFWGPALFLLVTACGHSSDDFGGPDASLDVSSTGGRAGSAATAGSGGSPSGTDGAGGAGGNGPTGGTAGTGVGGSAGGSAGSSGAGGAGSGGEGGSTTGSGGASGSGTAGSGGAGGPGAGGTGGSSGGTGGAGASGTGGFSGSTAGAAGIDAGGPTGTGGGGKGGAGGGSAGTGNTGGTGSGGRDASADADATGTGGRATPVCGGMPCGTGQDCCLLTNTCFNVSNRAACPKPPDSNGATGCGSNTDCADDEFCNRGDSILCMGAGYCDSMTNCGTSSNFLICGCNGITYPNYQSTCADGVRIPGTEYEPCGTPLPPHADGGVTIVRCGLDSQCPTGQKCCGITGQCYDPVAQNGICSMPPAGTTWPCLVDSDCYPEEYCAGSTCSGPGGCKPVGGNCNGELLPVCGCNGKNYMNASCADVSGVRVRYTGYCTDAGTDAGTP